MQLHSIKEYAELIEKAGLAAELGINEEDYDRIIYSLSYNTNKMGSDCLFICKGATFKEEYVKDAVSRGARLFISEKKFSFFGVSFITVKNIRLAMSLVSAFHYNYSDDMLYKIALTGTKGKSTTSYFIKSILDCHASMAGKKPCGLISSIENYDGVTLTDSGLSTPESPEIFRYLRNAADAGLDYMVIESSSQGLKYNRLDNITFDAALLLNVGYDHISPIEHPDFEDYFKSKLKLFDADRCRTAFLNTGDQHYEDTVKYIDGKIKTITFGLTENADYYGYYIRPENGLLAFYVKCGKFNREFRISMKGVFNVENALAAIAVTSEMGIPAAAIEKGLLVARVKGRMEHFESQDGNINAIVDYAHNKLSFERLFTAVKNEFPDKDIVAVFGCPGNKAYNRRTDLPAVAEKYCSHVYITEDDPGDEDPSAIAAEIASHITLCPFTVINERGDAIKDALDRFSDKAVIVALGKGSENAQKKHNRSVPYKGDKYYIEEWINKYDDSKCHH